MDELKRQLGEIHARNMLANDYQKTLALLAALKSGAVNLDQVNLTADGWQILELKIADEPPPAE